MRALALVDGEHYPPVTRWGIEVARERGYDVSPPCSSAGSRSSPTSPSRIWACRSAARARTVRRPSRPRSTSSAPTWCWTCRTSRARVSRADGRCRRGARARRALRGSGLPARPAGAARAPAGDPDPRGLRHRQADRQDRRRRRGRAGRGAPRPRAGRGRDGSRRSAGTPGRGGRQRDLELLLELVRSGEHAASDYLEDALTTGVTTIGARRAGGGLAGAPFASNVPEALRLPPIATPGSRSSRAAVPRCRRSPGTQASSSCRRPARWSTSAATWVRTASCGRILPWLPWLADRLSERERLPPRRASPGFPR